MKPNNKNFNNNRNNNNQSYFDKEIQKGGEAFLNKKNPSMLSTDVLRAIKDLVRGNVDIVKHGHYFFDPTFSSTLIQSCTTRYQAAQISADGVKSLINNLTATSATQIDPLVFTVLDKHSKEAMAYSIILNNLNYMYSTGDINYLYAIVSQLAPYKYNM